MVVPGDRSAETLLRHLEQEFPDAARYWHWIVCKRLVDDIRAAGGTWAAYRRQARKDVLRVRSLVMRGRAKPRKSSVIEKVFRLPNELAWHVLQFWRATDAAGEVL